MISIHNAPAVAIKPTRISIDQALQNGVIDRGAAGGAAGEGGANGAGDEGGGRRLSQQPLHLHPRWADAAQSRIGRTAPQVRFVPSRHGSEQLGGKAGGDGGVEGDGGGIAGNGGAAGE